LEQITTQCSDIKKLLIAIEHINIQLAALQTSAKEQQKLSCEENQLIRDENKQLREELKDLKISRGHLPKTQWHHPCFNKISEDTATCLDKISEDTTTRLNNKDLVGSLGSPQWEGESWSLPVEHNSSNLDPYALELDRQLDGGWWLPLPSMLSREG
jgi:regulator of replication initiation timing